MGQVKKTDARQPVSITELLKKHAPRARAAGDPVEIGDTSARETVGSREITRGDTDAIKLVFKGMYDDLALMQPDKGTTYTEFDGYQVESSSLKPMSGGVGLLEITLQDTALYSSIGGSLLETIWEIDWMRHERPIQTHSLLFGYTEAADQLEMWRSEKNRVLRTAFKYLDESGEEQELTGNVRTVAEKILRGVESYLVFSPVIRKTSTYKGRPTTGGCGTIDTPDVAVSGYTYLKTADRLLQQTDKKWQRSEEWTGALTDAGGWDTDLYSAGA